MFERYTERARKAVMLAREEAGRLHHDYVGTEHLLVGLLLEREGVAARALSSLGITLAEARERVEDLIGYGSEKEGPAPFTEGAAPFVPRSKKVLELALREALQLGHNYIGTEHLLLGLARETTGTASRILSELGVRPEEIRREVIRMLGGGRGEAATGAKASGRVHGARRAYLGVESGSGDRLRHLRVAVEALEGGPLGVSGRSGVYETEIADPDGERHTLLSCVLEVESGMPAGELLRYCQGVEAALGRAGGEGEAPARRVGIYLLLYAGEVTKGQHLTVPHPSVLLARNLKGLAEIRRGLRIPEVAVGDLLMGVDLSGVRETGEEV